MLYYRNAIRTEEEIDAMLKDREIATFYVVEGLPTDSIFEDRDEAIAYATEQIAQNADEEDFDVDAVTLVERRIATKDERDQGSEWWPDIDYWTMRDVL